MTAQQTATAANIGLVREFLGIPATGRTIEYVSHEFYQIVDGLIVEEWICSDMATRHGQLAAGST